MPDFSKLREIAQEALAWMNKDLGAVPVSVRPWHVVAAAACVLALAIVL